MSAEHAVGGPLEALTRLERLPGGPELLAQARRREDIALVGGAVRDLLLGHWPRELDVTVTADAGGLASALAASISPSERPYGHTIEPTLHDRFGTASVRWDYGRIDIAERRAESYPAPGALPEVRPGTIEEDLARRDFTVNAISLQLGSEGQGDLQAHPAALEDLAAGTLRILHEDSFRDDPTRILRLARYAARLGFQIDPATRELVRAAIAGGALGTVSGSRIGSELWLAACEQDGRGSFRQLAELGVLQALGLEGRFDDRLAAEAEALLPPEGRREMLLMAVAFQAGTGSEAGRTQLMNQLAFDAEQRERVHAGSSGLAARAEELGRAKIPPAPYQLLASLPLEALAVLGALSARHSAEAGAAVREWLATGRHVRLEIDGSDLLGAGVPEGPEVGRRLASALDRKRAGELNGRDEELRAALDAEGQ